MQPDRAIPPPDFIDEYGDPWWAMPPIPCPPGREQETRDAEEDLSHWWLRQLPSGAIQARHRTSRRVRDVLIEAGTQEPGRMLLAHCYTAVAYAKWQVLHGE